MKPVPTPPKASGDDLDALLRAYFQAEMPAAWPAFRPPAKARLLPFRERPTAALPPWASRAALVAACLFLLAATALMPRFPAGGAATQPTLPASLSPPGAHPG